MLDCGMHMGYNDSVSTMSCHQEFIIYRETPYIINSCCHAVYVCSFNCWDV